MRLTSKKSQRKRLTPASWPKVDMTIASQVLENNQGYTEENDEG
jgi:hypothetical protein